MAAEILGSGIVVEAPLGREVLLRPPAILGGNAGGNSRRSRKRRSCWRSMIRSVNSGKRRPRRRRGQWTCKSMQFDQSMNALAISHYPTAGVPSLPLAVEKRRGQNDLLGAPQLRWIEAELLHKVFGMGSLERSSSKLSGSSSGTAGSWRPWAKTLLLMVVERPNPERRRTDQAWCLTLCSVGLGLGPCMWILHVFPGTVSWASERVQSWSLFERLAELLEFARVEPEGSVVPFVRLTILGPVDRVHKRPGVFCSVVLCGLHWYPPGVRGVGENKITIEFVASARVFLWCESQSLAGQPVGALSIRLVGALCGHCEGSFRRVSSNCPDAHPVPERFSKGQQHN